MYQDHQEPPVEEFEEELFDVENGVPFDDAEGEPTKELEMQDPDELAFLVSDDNIVGQEDKGTRKIIQVTEGTAEEPAVCAIDGKELPEKVSQALWETQKLFGDFILAVDESGGKNKKWAISQALMFKSKDLMRTIFPVRLSAAREIYGFLVNKGLGDKFELLEVARTPEEKKALKKPNFFNTNHGYEA
ncbi:MAG: hypothetical protein ACWGQW_04500 [bacterium]